MVKLLYDGGEEEETVMELQKNTSSGCVIRDGW